MSEYLVVRLAEDPADVSWVVLNEQGHRLSPTGRGSLAAAATQRGSREVFVLVSGLEAISTSVTLPVTRRSKIERMLPYSLEDAVAADVDSLLFAAGPRREDGTIPVAVVARHRVEHWLARCAEAGLDVDAIFVDVQGVPETPGNLTLVLENDKIYGRLPERDPFVFDGLHLDELVEILQTEKDPSAYLNNVVVYADEAGIAQHGEALERLRDRVAALDVNRLADGVLPRLAATFVSAPGSNLLQGPYRVKSDVNELLKPWRTPAVLVGVLVLTAVLLQAGRYLSLNRTDEALTAVLESNCMAAFATERLQACDAKIRTRLATTGGISNGGDANAFLETLHAIATSRGEQTTLQALSFRDGVTNLRVIAPDVQALDALAQALASEGRFQANIQSATPADDGIEGRLQIAELAP